MATTRRLQKIKKKSYHSSIEKELDQPVIEKEQEEEQEEEQEK